MMHHSKDGGNSTSPSQSEKAIAAVKDGTFIGFLETSEGEVLKLFEYEGILFGHLEKPMSVRLKAFLDLLDDQQFLDSMIAAEFADELFAEPVDIVCSRHVRADLL